MKIGKAIRDLRQQKGIKQVDFAEKCGLSQSYLSHIEKGTKEPTLSILKQIADTLSVPLPILIFLSIDSDDISSEKKETYNLLEPSIKGLINNVFIHETV